MLGGGNLFESILSFDSSSSRLRLIGTLEILDYKVYDGVKCTEAG